MSQSTPTPAKSQLITPPGYRALDASSVLSYLAQLPSVASRLGTPLEEWSADEIGDGNLNLVFIARGPRGAIVVKQSLPYVRLIGESWPLPLDRAYYEHRALSEAWIHAPEYTPAIYHHDHDMALTVMEYLTPHIILRKGLIAGVKYPHLARHLGAFLARTLFNTSDLALSPITKREKIAQYLGNTAMCKITEDLIFDEPYYQAEMNNHTTPQLDEIARGLRTDITLKLAVQELKYRFMNHSEALLHADLHTGSVMVTEDDTRVIDPEFAFFGPMGFDVGLLIANLLFAYFAQPGHGTPETYAAWIKDQINEIWEVFTQELSTLWTTRASASSRSASLYDASLCTDAPELSALGLQARLRSIFEDTLGFAGCEMIRRVVGLAHVEDLESIADPDTRASCEAQVIACARRFIVERAHFTSMRDALEVI